MIKIKILNMKLLYCNFILEPLFQSAQQFNEKREGSELVTERSRCLYGRPKNIQIQNRMRIRNTNLNKPYSRITGRKIKRDSLTSKYKVGTVPRRLYFPALQ
jgi:hypothetical protein